MCEWEVGGLPCNTSVTRDILSPNKEGGGGGEEGRQILRPVVEKGGIYHTWAYGA